MDGNALYDRFYNHVERTLRQVYETQRGAIFSAARMICAALDRGGRFLVTGTGHSHMLAEEFYVRAGGLACVTPILPPEFMLHEHPLKSTAVERVPEYAHVILSLYGVKEQDVLFIASNSGRNGLIVELALGAKARGAAVIALTARAGMAGQPSRHASGLHLADAADLVIDNCGAEGDAACELTPGGARMGATSTIAGAFIVQQIALAAACGLRSAGKEPPVFLSSNVDGADAENSTLFAHWYHAGPLA